MLHILGFLFFIVLIIFVIGVAILAKIVRTVTRAGQRMKDADFICQKLLKSNQEHLFFTTNIQSDKSTGIFPQKNIRQR